ncbi:hypothetical protein [Ferrimonas lipolytica]|uniref:Uncharacterized protein n=1 Tax=Ferrimonas lipolytica TaxID=2724191 RepID=A0A6H1UJN4_9GAMM|nr:hypothetical protein [Ferrimonas lipolytica]QIZ78523.1 hypothetical protein HER31_17445 [Ferrimonas lipolytica]
MSHFIRQLSHSRLEKLFFIFFSVSLFIFSVAVIDVILSSSADRPWQSDFWQQGEVLSTALTLGGSICIGYVFHILARMSQKIRFDSLVSKQLQLSVYRLEQLLESLLLLDSQHPQNPKVCYGMMLDNIAEAPFVDNQPQIPSTAGKLSLPIRIDMADNFAKHVAIMEGVALQLRQLQALSGRWKSDQNDHIDALLKLLNGFNSELLINTQQEKWAKLHNAYRPLCQYLAKGN